MLTQLRQPSSILLMCLLTLTCLATPAAKTALTPGGRVHPAQGTMPRPLMGAFLAITGQTLDVSTGAYRSHSGSLNLTPHANDKELLVGLALRGVGRGQQIASLQDLVRVSARGLVQPTVIDSLIYLEQKVVASDGAAMDLFGTSVALSGNTALVGAPADAIGANSEQGSAYVFVHDGTTWSEQAQLTASDGMAGDYFGVSVALSGDTALVGAYEHDVGTNINQGAVYVFLRSGMTWMQQAKLTASDGAAVDHFGISVALSDDTALVGAYGDDVEANDGQGSAYVFTRSGMTWTQQEKLTASDGAPYDRFGGAVAISGDTALVGAFEDNIGMKRDQGSAYVFVRSGTSWIQQAHLLDSQGDVGDFFGRSVAISGNTALVGADWDDAGTGSASVFVRDGTAWSEQGHLTAWDGAEQDWFGISVALSDDTALVGAYGDDVGINDSQGSAYVFMRSGTTWAKRAKLTASDGAWEDSFGRSVALSGHTALVGADWDYVSANVRQGSAYFYIPDWFEVYLPVVVRNTP